MAVSIYDRIMLPIDPDLISTAVEHLEEKYRNETAKGRALRMQRYEKAYKIFDERLQAYLLDLHERAAGMKRKAIAQQEGESQKSDEYAMQSLSSQFL